MQSMLWAGAAGCVMIAGVAILSDHRHQRRTDLDKIGWVPWPLVMIIAMIAAALLIAFAIQSG